MAQPSSNKMNQKRPKPANDQGPIKEHQEMRGKLEEASHEPDAKRQKLLANTNLTDVNNDCLEHIFGYLKVQDLFSVAMADEGLRYAAESAFKRKYGRKLISFHREGILVYVEDRPQETVYHAYHITEISEQIAFLRRFGQQISKLCISGRNNAEYKLFESVVFEQCVASLVELSLGDEWSQFTMNVFEGIQQPFANVKKASFVRCHFNERAAKLNKWFPQLRHLALIDNTFVAPTVVVTKYPHIKRLAIGNFMEIGLTKEHAIRMVQLNPQITDLSISLAADGYEFQFYRQLNELLPQLNRLHLCWESNSFEHHDGAIIAFKHLKKLMIDFSITSFNSNRMLPFAVDQLAELEVNNVPLMTHEWMHFITQNKELTKLSVLPINFSDAFFDRPNNQDLKQFGKELPKLTELTIDVSKITVNCIVQFVSKCDSIVTLRLYWDKLGFSKFQYEYSTRGTDIFRKIQDKWNVCVSAGRIVLERKDN